MKLANHGERARWNYRTRRPSPANPAELLALVKSATAVHVAGPASGPGWTGTKCSFTLSERDPNEAPEQASGTLSVDSAAGSASS